MATVRKRPGKNGVSWQIDYLDPEGKRVRKSFKKKKDAQAELGKRVSLMAEGRYLDVKKDLKITLYELTEKYTENFKTQKDFYPGKERYLRNFKTYFGEKTFLANIHYVDLETYWNKLREKPTIHGTIRKAATVNREMACLKHLFTKAVEWDMAESNPFAKGENLIIKENNKRLRFLSKEEIQRLLAECPDYLKRVVECALNTGMRKGEILSLKWSQVKTVKVWNEEEQKKEPCSFIYLQKTKTNESRQIPVNDTLEEVFRKTRKEKHFKSEYIFTDRKNKPLKTVKRGFRAAVNRAGIEDFRFHDLRHTFASHFVMSGGSLKSLQEILGHADVTMTMRYAHLSREHKKKEVNLLNGLTANVSQNVTNSVLSKPSKP